MGNYEERQQAKKDRFLELAENARQKSTAEFKKADMSEGATGIPLGQPILVGHHSEGRHRRTIERADNAMRRSIEADSKAEYYEGKAKGVGTGGISSDDPDALEKLRSKLEGLEKSQERMKAANKIIKSKKGTDAEKIELGFSKSKKASNSIDLENDTKYALVVLKLAAGVKQPGDYAQLKTAIVAITGITDVELVIDTHTIAAASVPANRTQVAEIRFNIKLRNDT